MNIDKLQSWLYNATHPTETKKEPVMKYKTHIITPATLVVILTDGKGGEKVYSFTASSTTYNRFKAAIEAKDMDAIPVIVDPALRVADQCGSDVKIDQGVMSIGGEDVPKELAEEIRKAAMAGVDTTGLKAMWQRLKKNPIRHAIAQTFRFIKKNGVHVLPDGRFILYKGVDRTNTGGVYKARRGSGTPFEYRLGVMAQERGGRAACDGNPSVACGRGLHAAPWTYVNNIYGGGALISLICDPEDVVGVPHDADSQKMRLWQVFPQSEVTGPITDALVTTKRVGVIGRVTQTLVNVIKKDNKSITVPISTDRITLPVEFMNLAGFQRDSTVLARVTDKRSRFVEVSVNGESNGSKKGTFEKEVKMLSSGAFSLRLAVLREAQIGDAKNYVAKVEGPGVIHIRPK